MIKSDNPIHCKTSITIKYVPKRPDNHLKIGIRNAYPIPININPRIIPFLIRLAEVPLSCARINK